ncbi:unnamed protein product [Allacma fusca]|uniref:Uncharacterized protein n=1 Tax=Allacma fusca TaxID=39272 RepID=A0A8J2KYK0_9HEXA|nr:unnamed protein product [Allacma fusca]
MYCYFQPFSVLLLLICATLVTSNNLTDSEILAFDAPAEIKSSFPYYLSGYDEDGAPIWLFEFGKWDMRKYAEQGGKLQAGHLKTVQFILSKFGRFEQIVRDGAMKQGCFVNGNALWSTIWNLGSPLLGALANSVEIYGTNKKVWIPKLLKVLPRDQIPEKYGGLPSHEPLKILG